MQISKDGRQAWLNFHHLYYFKVIATTGSIASAASILRLGQPTLSAQLKQFEDTLGIPLFERQHKKLLITEAGKKVLEYANEIFRLGGELMDVLHDQASSQRVHIQLGALDSIPKRFVADVIEQAYGFTACSVSLIEGKADELLRELANHRIDLFLANFVPSQQEIKGLISRTIAKETVGVYGTMDHKSLRKDFPSSLNGQPFIVPSFHSKLRHDMDHYFRLNGIHLDVIAETQDVSLQELLLKSGRALSALPQSAAKDFFEVGVLPGIYEEYFLISATRRIANPVAQHLMKNAHFPAPKSRSK